MLTQAKFNNYSKNQNYFSPPRDLKDAEERFFALDHEIKTIEGQLQDPARVNYLPELEYLEWKRKAQVALSAKIKQLSAIKTWISSHKDHRVLPSEITEEMEGGSSVIADDRKPSADRVIDNLCNAIMQTRSLKRRMYPFYKIANALFGLLKGNSELLSYGQNWDDIILWLSRAGYDTSLIRTEAIGENNLSAQDQEEYGEHEDEHGKIEVSSFSEDEYD